MLNENPDMYLDPSAHGLAATYDGSTAVEVIFEQDAGDAFDVTGPQPRAYGKASVFPAAAVGKTLVVNGTTYTIRDRRLMADGTFVELQLGT